MSEEIQTYEYVVCPYCNEKLTILQHTHLKKHGKTTQDLKNEYPGYPMKCLRLQELSKQGGQKSKETHSKMKKINCIYCGSEMEVHNNESNKQACKSCLSKGLENPDGRTKSSANQRRTETLKKKYGENVTNIAHIDGAIEKRSSTNLERYGGVGFASQELSEKTKKVIKDMYGDENIMRTEQGKKHFMGNKNPLSKENPNSTDARIKLSNSLKGKPSQFKNKSYEIIHGEEKANELKQKRHQYFVAKFLPVLQKQLTYLNLELLNPEYLGAHIKHNWKCTKCDYEFQQIWNALQQGYLCPQCYPRNQGFSKGEKEVCDFIKSLGFEIIENSRQIIPPYELDLLILAKNIAIEFHGLYWHSEDFCSDPKRHSQKMQLCNEKGIRLIQIFEDEWVLKREIVEKRLKHILQKTIVETIYARQCEVKEIDSKTKNEFLEKYHIQGPDNSTIKLGAFHNDELVSVMTFSKGNRAKGSKVIEGIWELNRFCSNYDYHIPGIASKLLEHFKRNYEWKEIFSYADLRWSDGNLYKQIGFETDNVIRLNYWYSKNGMRYHRFGLRKRPDEPKDITESVLRTAEGYVRIWDAGNLKFILKNS